MHPDDYGTIPTHSRALSQHVVLCPNNESYADRDGYLQVKRRSDCLNEIEFKPDLGGLAAGQ